MICKKKKDKTETLQVDGPAGCACSPQGQHFHLPSWPDESPGEKVHILIIHILYVFTRFKVQTQSYNSYFNLFTHEQSAYFLVPSLLLSSINKPKNQDRDVLEKREKGKYYY